MKNIFNTNNINKLKHVIGRAKNVLLAMFIFGSIGAYVGIQTMYALDTRTDDRINAVLKANHVVAEVPVTKPTSK